VDQSQLTRHFKHLVGATPSEKAAKAANETTVRLEHYFLNLLEERRRQPGDDLMSLLLQGQADGRLTPEEVASQCILLLIAGHVTTMDQLGNSALALLQHPQQMDRLCDNPKLIRSAVDKGLRYDGNTQATDR